MCGIAGFFGAKISQIQVAALMNILKHRGPDAQRFYLKDGVGLIHTRLSIIELSSMGDQPYRFENLVLTFNGEIYNYPEIRDELKKYGYSFVSNSDTEVLIKAFHCWGEACVDHLIGMFVFAIYDDQSQVMYLFRDRLGVKPVYYSRYNGSFFFASELKAFSIFDISKEIDFEALYFYFRFGYIPAHLSIFQNIKKLEPGVFIKITNTNFTKKRYWCPGIDGESSKSENELTDELESLLISAFRYRMVSDVPVGVFLSGGIDSSLLAAILQKHSGGIHSFTIGFEEKDYDESLPAAQVATLLGLKHFNEKLSLEKATNLFEQFYSIYDEPFADTSGIPIAFVTQLAKKSGMKVVLSADGGDELFGGYTHYEKASRLLRSFSMLPFALKNKIADITKIIFPYNVRKNIYRYNLEHKLFAIEELLSSANVNQFYEAFIANQASGEISHLIPETRQYQLAETKKSSHSIMNMMLWDLHYYLPDDLLVKVDRATMFYGIESREPFLDHRLVEFAFNLPMNLKIRNGQKKYLLKKVLSRYLPGELFERNKRGFSIPIFKWFSTSLDNLFNTFLSPAEIVKIPFLNNYEVQKEFAKYRWNKKNGHQYNIEKMWRILSFVMWYDKYGKART